MNGGAEMTLVVARGEHSNSDRHDTPNAVLAREKPDKLLVRLIDMSDVPACHNREFGLSRVVKWFPGLAS